VPFAVALDRCADDPREFIERASPTHPSVIDTEHVVAELYHIVNVPTMIWIDEKGRVCRPHDAQFGTDTFTAVTGKRSAPYLDMIRAWVRTGAGALSEGEVRHHQPVPSDASQRVRTERALAWHLQQEGRTEAAARHFDAAAALAPLDWTIRRGSMPIRGQNPFGPEFFALAQEGRPEYAMESVTPTQEEPSGS
jgi:hypothetical protein